MSEPLKPKRGFVDLVEWDAIGSDSPIEPIVWDDASVDGDDVCVLLIPDPDRDPTDAEAEALAKRLHGAEDAWPCLDQRDQSVFRICARAAFRLGARVKS